MGEIRVNPQMLRDTANVIKNESKNFQNLMSEMTQGLLALQSSFEGEAFESFKAQVNALKPALDKYAEVINSFGTVLDNAADIYDPAQDKAKADTQDLGLTT